MNAVRAQWFDIAHTEAALLHVILAHSAATYALLQQEDTWEPKESLILRTEAIRIINERIDNSNAGNLSDATVGAVACLAKYEVRMNYQIQSSKFYKLKLRGEKRTWAWADSRYRLCMAPWPTFRLTSRDWSKW